MGLTKQYLRYVPSGVLNVVGSGRGGAVYLDKKGELAAVAAVQDVVIWDLKKKERLRRLPGGKTDVSCLAVNGNGSLLAVGYHDGTIKLFDTGSGESEVTFTGHKTAVTALSFDKEGLRLVSGSRDTNIVVWDIVSECGLYRLHGHKGPVTAVKFINSQNVVVSASKDTFVKFWDLRTQHCFKTLTGHVNEVWDLLLLRSESILVTGGGDAELKIWQLSFKEDTTAPDGGTVSKFVTHEEPRDKRGKLDSDLKEDEEEGEKNEA